MKIRSKFLSYISSFVRLPVWLELLIAVILLGLSAIITLLATNAPANEPFVVARSDAAKDKLVFAALGDTGTGEQDQRAVANALAQHIGTNPLEFILLLGDQFYPSGVENINDSQWQSKFENMYDDTSFREPFFFILGNHEYEGNPQACIDYSSLSRRWRAPGRFYTFIYELPDGTKAQFFALDTYALGRWHRRWDGQLAWLERELARSDATWKIVYGHHPIVTGGKHSQSKSVIAAHYLLSPLFKKYGVDIYLSGHDHNLQVIKLAPDMFQLISGGGGGLLHPVVATPESLLATAQFGFMAISITSTTLSVSVISSNNEKLLEYDLIHINGEGMHVS